MTGIGQDRPKIVDSTIQAWNCTIPRLTGMLIYNRDVPDRRSNPISQDSGSTRLWKLYTWVVLGGDVAKRNDQNRLGNSGAILGTSGHRNATVIAIVVRVNTGSY